jgi:mycothiol maleylpyruvate isomerase-like protein
MSVDRTYIAENDAERGRLRALVARLSDADLARAMPAGWTVAGVLAHLAFWDQRILVLLEQWEQSPSKPPRIENEADTDWINDASKPLLLALAPRRAADLAVTIAEAVDGKVAALPDDLVARNAEVGSPLNLLRAEHRAEHLRELEHVFR